MLGSIAFLLCVTLLRVAGRSETECQPQIIRCPCGKSNTIVQIRLNCDWLQKRKYSCDTFENCETCEDGLNYCLTCPAGKSGFFCNEKTVLNDGFASENLVRNRRQSQQCPRLQSPKPGSVRCLYDNVKAECTGTCSPGYAFPDGKTEKIFQCNYNSRTWSPQSSFPPCKSRGQCDLELMGAGSYNCSTNNQGTFCDIRCSGFRPISGLFSCFPGRGWTPRLPHCAKKKGVSDVPQSCNCQNGGTCDPSTSRCRCLPDYEGRLCENRIQVTSPPPRCNCQNGGICDYLTSRCNCPSGYGGRHCQNKIEYSVPKQCSRDPGIVANAERRTEEGRIVSQNEEFYEGMIIDYTCNRGFILQGQASLTCLSSGAWSSDPPSCIQERTSEPTDLEYCDNPGSITNGKREVKLHLDARRPLQDDPPEFPEGTKLVYSCIDGYTLQGDNTLSCVSGFWWPEQKPSCTASRTEETTELEYCDNPGHISNGNREVVPFLNERRKPLPDDPPEFPEGTKLVYTCDDGYILQGENTLRCESGFWSPEQLPLCRSSTNEGRHPQQSTYCNDPGVPGNGDRYLLPRQDPKFRNSSGSRGRYPEGTQFVFYCDDNFVLQGEDLVICRRSGFWSSPLPVCNYESEELTDLEYCDNPGSITNGEREMILHLDARRPLQDDPPEFPEGTKLVYSCIDGYTLQGDNTLSCVSGFWSPEQKPSCTASLKTEECGRTSIGAKVKVTHGNRTEEGEWPWHVGIALPDHNGWDIKCGGVLISRSAVLTAAHCLPSRPRDILLYLGKYHRNIDDDDEEVQVKTPTRLIIHPNYNISAPFDSDIAVIRFSPPATFSDRIQPICLPDAETTKRNLVAGKRGWVTGWGITERRLPSDALLKGRLPVVSTNQCRETYRQQRLNIDITNNMFCAGYEEGGVDSCEGDSGGPLMFLSDRDRSYVLEGLVSFGSSAGCGQPKHYSVYTKVSNFIDWIEANI